MTMIDLDRAGNLRDEYTFEIALINLTFTNSSMLRLHQRRGKAIKNNQVKEVDKCNNKIIHVASKKEAMRKLCEPRTAFVTFQYI